MLESNKQWMWQNECVTIQLQGHLINETGSEMAKTKTALHNFTQTVSTGEPSKVNSCRFLDVHKFWLLHFAVVVL